MQCPDLGNLINNRIEPSPCPCPQRFFLFIALEAWKPVSVTELKKKIVIVTFYLTIASLHPKLHDSNLQFWFFFLRVMRYKLAIVSYKVRIAWYKLTVASYEVRIFILQFWLYFSQLQIYIMQFWEKKSQNCEIKNSRISPWFKCKYISGLDGI